jgi:PAS domain S-box-containing protein
MEHMIGGVNAIMGYDPDDIIGNKVHSFVGLTHDDDKERAFATVDAAIERGEPWDMVYRMKHANGGVAWIRERGSAVFENGELSHLQGLVVSADEEVAAQADLEKLLNETQTANGEIIDLTKKITGSIRQLTMLAINARIEAARLGDDGRGFTIVAEEMKRLADQNAQWANIISKKMTQSNAST